MTNKEIGERIKSTREELELTMAELAARVGVGDTTILRYERGEINKLKLPVIQSIANALGVDPSWLVGQTETKYSEKRVELKDTYFSFAKEMQEKNISKEDMDKLWQFYEMIKKM